MVDRDLFGEVVPPPPTVYFKSSTTQNDDGWMMCDCGMGMDNNKWVVTTHHLKADEVPEECADAKSFSELVAKLLNEYFNK
jgi:hypothetical protein